MYDFISILNYDKVCQKYIDGLNFKVLMSVHEDVKMATMLKMD